MQKKLNEDFIDSYCEKFASKITDTFFSGDKETITGKEILEVTPSKQTNLFVIKLIFQYWQGESKKLESPFFNYGNESVLKALEDFMNVLSQNIEIHKNRFQLLLNHAVKDTIYLAASPQAYLEIDLDGMVEVDEIDDKVIDESVKYIKIYKKEIQNFLSDMRGLAPDDAIDELDDEFEPFDSTQGLAKEVGFLSEVISLKPDQILSEDFPDDFDEFDDDVFDNDDAPSESKAKSEPEPEQDPEPTSEPEPEIEDNEAKFQKEESSSAPQGEEGEGDLPDMGASIDWGTSIADSSPEEDELAFLKEVEAFEKKSTEETSDEVEEEVQEAPEPSAEVEDLPEEVVEEPVDEMVEAEQDEEPEDSDKEDSETINDQFEAPQTVAEHHEEKKSSSMMELISVNHQYMFVKELFKDDQVSFQNALYDLEDYESFDDAVEFLVQGYAKEFAWDMQSNEVKELLKVLFRKYRN